MKILVLNPFAGGMQELERCGQVAGPDTEVVFEDISEVYPLKEVNQTSASIVYPLAAMISLF